MVSPSPVEGPGGKEGEADVEREEVEVADVSAVAADATTCASAFLGPNVIFLFCPLRDVEQATGSVRGRLGRANEAAAEALRRGRLRASIGGGGDRCGSELDVDIDFEAAAAATRALHLIALSY